MSGLFGGSADTSEARAQMKQQRMETERLRAQEVEEKRDLAEKEASRRMARTRGGSRLLLSEDRLSPEEGLDETLGG